MKVPILVEPKHDTSEPVNPEVSKQIMQPVAGRKKTPSARSKARRRAVEILFEADQRGLDPLQLLQETPQRLGFALHPYTHQLVQGVAAQREQVEQAVSQHSHEWTLTQMPAVDRVILLVGAYELLAHSQSATVAAAQTGDPAPSEPLPDEPSPDATTVDESKPRHVQTPVPVVISEAVSLAALLSTEASPAFVNGVLDAIANSAQ